MPSRYPGRRFVFESKEGNHVKILKRILAGLSSRSLRRCGPASPPSPASATSRRLPRRRRNRTVGVAVDPADRPATVRLALDWTPEHQPHRASTSRAPRAGTTQAGIDLQILPYASTTPETLLAAHQAECGISFQDSLTFAVAAGARHRQRRRDPPADGVRRSASWPTARSSARATSTARPTRASATRTRSRRSRP